MIKMSHRFLEDYQAVGVEFVQSKPRKWYQDYMKAMPPVVKPEPPVQNPEPAVKTKSEENPQRQQENPESFDSLTPVKSKDEQVAPKTE